MTGWVSINFSEKADGEKKVDIGLKRQEDSSMYEI